MDSIPELLEAIESQGWTITATAHGLACQACHYAALNGMVGVRPWQQTATGWTGPGQHEATITRKNAS